MNISEFHPVELSRFQRLQKLLSSLTVCTAEQYLMGNNSKPNPRAHAPELLAKPVHLRFLEIRYYLQYIILYPYICFFRKTKASGLHCAQCWSGEANFYT